MKNKKNKKFKKKKERREAENRSCWAESERQSHKDNRVTKLGFFFFFFFFFFFWGTIELFCFVYCLSHCH